MDNFTVYVMDEKGHNQQLLLDIKVNEMAYHDSYVYFTNYKDGFKLYRIQLDGTDLRRLTDVRVKSLDIDLNRGGILYREYDTDKLRIHYFNTL